MSIPSTYSRLQPKVRFIKEATTPVDTIPITTRLDAQQFNDREVATGYLLTLKRAGREYAWCTMEASNPELREFLKDAFTMCCNHSYEVWQWMVSKGYYPLILVHKKKSSK